jgi:ABC-type branched-chain amino acid transport systems, ATPase component
MTICVRCVGITKYFGGLAALKNVSLEVSEGEIRAIIGPNGAGKTTLFNIINGVYKPTSGRVYIKINNVDYDVTGLPPHIIFKKFGVARTLQIPRIFKNLTVWENIMVGGLFTNLYTNNFQLQAYVTLLLEMLGLTEKAYVKAGKLNLQEMKKVELARALASKPKILLIDEYMSGLNTLEVEEAIDMLKRLRKEFGLTIIWIEHVISAVASLADTVTVLNEGMKIAEGIPKEIINDPVVIQAYLGEEKVAEPTKS